MFDFGFEWVFVKLFGERRDWFFGEIYMVEVKDYLEIKFCFNDGLDIGFKLFFDVIIVVVLKEIVVF